MNWQGVLSQNVVLRYGVMIKANQKLKNSNFNCNRSQICDLCHLKSHLMHFAQMVLGKGHFALNREGINSQRAQVCATFYICTFMYSLQLSLQYICRINQHIPWRAPAGVLFYTESAFTLLLALNGNIYICRNNQQIHRHALDALH